MDVLKRIGSVTMFEEEFRSHHGNLVVVPGVVYISKYVTDYNIGNIGSTTVTNNQPAETNSRFGGGRLRH
jgi:hypothetical protein